VTFIDPNTAQDPTTGLVAPFAWGDDVDASFNFLRGAKVGCRLSSVVGTAIGGSTVMPWATEVFDVGGCHDNVTNNSRITVPASWGGLWFVGANLCATAGGIILVEIALNGTSRPAGQASNPDGTVDTDTHVETILVLVAGDYVELWATGAGNRSTGDTSTFYAQWLASGV
jgi:hypothetical protein